MCQTVKPSSYRMVRANTVQTRSEISNFWLWNGTPLMQLRLRTVDLNNATYY